jgi:hypothetical protein
MTDWHQQAACRGLDTTLFFAEKGDHATAQTALHYCNGGTYDILDNKNKPIGRGYTEPCPVKQQCLNYALSFPADQDAYGIYGGCTPNQRDKMRRGTISRIVREPSRIERDTTTSSRIERDPEPPAADGEPVARWQVNDTWRAGVRELLTLIHDAMIDDENRRRTEQGRGPVAIPVRWTE